MNLISNWRQQPDVVSPILYALFGVGLTLHIFNLSFFALLIVALVRLFAKPVQPVAFHEAYQACRLLHWAMASTLIALVLTQIGHGYVELAPYNPIARLAIFY